MKFFHVMFVALFFILFAQTASSQTSSAPQDDTQNWNDVQIAVPVNKKLDFNLFGQLRFGRNFRDFVDEQMAIGTGSLINRRNIYNLRRAIFIISTDPHAAGTLMKTV